eukprot:3851369-Rhodomonas_salina.3
MSSMRSASSRTRKAHLLSATTPRSTKSIIRPAHPPIRVRQTARRTCCPRSDRGQTEPTVATVGAPPHAPIGRVK